MKSSFLGIDLGTTNVKISLIDDENRVLSTNEKAHNAQFCGLSGNRNEQCPKKILQTLEEIIAKIGLTQLGGIGISGQMHGIMRWKADTLNSSLDQCKCSRLYTWMDGRCDEQFLNKLPKWICKNSAMNVEKTEKQIATGYGMATLAWLKANGKEQLLNDEVGEWDRAGTIMDFLAAYLIQSNSPVVMSDQNAESWGYKNAEENEWTILGHPDHFPLHLLPKIVKSGAIIGQTSKNIQSTQMAIPPGVPVLVPVGDLSASMLPILNRGEAALHIGTSAQLAFFVESTRPFTESLPPSIVQVPFFDGNSLLVAASLNGGNALDFFIQQINDWSRQLFGSNQNEKLSKNSNSAILDRIFLQNSDHQNNCQLSVIPTFYGERHNPRAGAIIEGWRAENSLEEFLCSIARGIVQNLALMMPQQILSAHKISRMKLIGRAGQKIFEQEAKRQFPNLEVLNGEEELVSAAFGAALYAKQALIKKE